MKRKRHGPEPVIAKWREAELWLSQGAAIAAVSKRREASEQTYHRWRNQFGGMKGPPGATQASDGASPRDCLISERRACKATGQPRSMQRYPQRPVDDKARLLADLKRLSTQHSRVGSTRIGDLLRREGWDMNHERVERLWRREGLQVPQRQRKRLGWGCRPTAARGGGPSTRTLPGPTTS